MKRLRELGSVRLRPVSFDQFRIKDVVMKDGGLTFKIVGVHGRATEYYWCDDMGEVQWSFEAFLRNWREGEEDRAEDEYYTQSGIVLANRLAPATLERIIKAAIDARHGR